MTYAGRNIADITVIMITSEAKYLSATPNADSHHLYLTKNILNLVHGRDVDYLLFTYMIKTKKKKLTKRSSGPEHT